MKKYNPCEYRKTESDGYWKRVQSMWIPKNGRIRASTGTNYYNFIYMHAQMPNIIFFSSRRRHTRFKCDWSSDVCSSDLVESVRVSKNCSDEYRKRVQSVWASKNGRILVSTMKKYNPCEYQKIIRMGTRKGSNLCEYRKMVESVQVPGKGRIRASIEKLFRCVPEKVPINVSTEKWKNPGEYHEKV